MSQLSFEEPRGYLGCRPEGRKERSGEESHFWERDPSAIYAGAAALIKNDQNKWKLW